MNIAPLNFLVRGAEAVSVKVGSLTVTGRGEEVIFDEREWRQLLEQNQEITVSVTALKDGRWTEYKSFSWHVVKDKLDPWLTYRLIEPDYEVWNNLQIIQRCVEDFEYERNMAEANKQIGGVETIILYTRPEYAHISSTLVRDLYAYGKDVSAFVPNRLR